MNVTVTKAPAQQIVVTTPTSPKVIVPAPGQIKLAVQSAPRATIYFGNTNPNVTGPFIWVQTGLGDGHQCTLWIEDGT